MEFVFWLLEVLLCSLAAPRLDAVGLSEVTRAEVKPRLLATLHRCSYDSCLGVFELSLSLGLH